MSPESAPDILTLHAGRQPDKPAVIDDRPDGRSLRWTFADLEAEANRLAHTLRDLGVERGDKVVWCGQNSPGIVRMMHAARKIGSVAVPLNYRLAPEEAAYVVDHCDACLVYVDAEFAPMFEKIRRDLPRVRDVLVFDGDPLPGQHALEPLLDRATPEPPAADGGGREAGTMIYTSGTTGRPKGALREGLGDRSQVLALVQLIGYRPDDVYLTTGPLYHSGPGGFMSIAHTLGQTVVVQRKFQAEDWLRLVDRHRVSSTFAAPTPIRLVCNLPAETRAKYDVSSMRIMIANAAPWSYALKEAYLRHFPEKSLYEVYGSTELGVNAVLLPEDQRRKKGSCGKPSPGVELALFDDEGRRITTPHTPGELFARSASVFTTYYKARDKYEEDRRGEFHTVGDVAYFDEDGYFYICDRKKDMIISGGMNIYPAEIEAALEHHPAIHDAAVFGIPSEEWGESVHAVVVLNPGFGLGPRDVIEYAREHLASYKIPRSVSFMNELPRTGSGKILKRELREPFWKGHESRLL